MAGLQLQNQGIYNILNVEHEPFSIDLQASVPPDGAPLIVYPLNLYPDGTLNQQWRLRILPDTTFATLTSQVDQGIFARVEHDGLYKGSSIIGSRQPTVFSIEPVGGDRYKIKIPNWDLMLTLTSGTLKAQIILCPSNGSESQLWKFKPIEAPPLPPEFGY